MGLEEVENDIKKRIEAQVASIRGAVAKEAQGILDAAKSRIAELQQQRSAELKTLTDELQNREVAAANLSARKLRMDAKTEMIDAVYSKVKGKLLALGVEGRAELIESLIEKAVTELQDSKYVRSNSDDKKIITELIDGTGLDFGGVEDCSGGVVVENKDCTIRVDYTYETLLDIFKKDTLKEVTGQLFKK